jgi:energy-coupling factor transporter ATP-binding protein EcfA2
VLPEIVDWSESLPTWQRDALRRVVLQRDVTDDDIEQLTTLAKKAHGLADNDIEPVPLSAAHVPVESSKSAVSLRAVKHLGDVNALAAGQTLSFAESGLTVVYGDNGAGKSGYSRILKRACRARGSGDAILANAFSDAPGATPRAEIVAVADGIETVYPWRDGVPGPDVLTAVSVFDSAAAQVYVSNKTDVAFRPRGLDVLDRLADVVKKVQQRLEREQKDLERPVSALPDVARGTAVGKLLGSLTALTPPNTVETLASITDAEREEIDRLRIVVAEAKAHDPVKRAGELRARIGRYRSLIKHVVDVTRHVDGKAAARVAEMKVLADDARRAAAAAVLARGTYPLPGVGSAAWQALWDAAAKFGESVAHIDHAFPLVDNGARCLLCQQEFDDASKARMREFVQLVADHTQRAAIEASAAVEKARAALGALRPVAPVEALLDELAEDDQETARAVRSFLETAEENRRSFLAMLDEAEPTPSRPVHAPSDRIEQVCRSLEDRAADFTRSADPAARSGLEASLAELEARSTLAKNKAAVIAEIARLARVNAYSSCLTQARTNAITKKSTELTKVHVSDALATAFEAELKKVGFEQPELELRPVEGRQGALLHQIRLKHATRADLFRVVSEGEARCLALAAFLAELSVSSHASGIIFDDPVSSLDHRWRTHVAARLVDEARTRQVVVFTHELVFLQELVALAKEFRVDCATRSLRRERGTAGLVEDDLPWMGRTLKQRLGWLRGEHQQLAKIHREGSWVDYEARATAVYARLRTAWERAVEEVVLGGAVIRFRSGIETKKLRVITQEEIDLVTRGMSKTSRWEGGHDHAAAVNAPVPGPAELKDDIDALEAVVTAVNKRT